MLKYVGQAYYINNFHGGLGIIFQSWTGVMRV
jgi:hypothetical protein